MKKHQKTTPRKGGRKSQNEVFFWPGTPWGTRGPPGWPQGASQDTFFMILGAPGCLRGSIFDAFSSILLHIPRPLCTAKRGGGVGRSPLDPAHRQMPAVWNPSPGLPRVLAWRATPGSPTPPPYHHRNQPQPIKFCTSKLRRILGGFWALLGTLLETFLDNFCNIFRVSVLDHFLDTFFIIFGSILASFFDHFLMFFWTWRICENCAPA